MQTLDLLRARIRADHLADEGMLLTRLIAAHGMGADRLAAISTRAGDMVQQLRKGGKMGLAEAFMAQYALSSREGTALMALAEALLRVPDAATQDALIADKIAPFDWAAHFGASRSGAVNGATFALMAAKAALRSPLRRVAAPIIRAGAKGAMRVLGGQFVLGQTIGAALAQAGRDRARGLTHSFDMLGEAALTAADADAYFTSYSNAIAALAADRGSANLHERPSISIKLSALHPRYETAQIARVLAQLTPRVQALARQAKAANIGLNIDAEEAARLEVSLDVIEATLRDTALAGWEGFGVVVQAYSKRAPSVIDWLYALAETLDRKIMLRLVKGAYWDSEIKRAQVEGLADYPVYTRKAATDAAYICCAAKLLGMGARIYPQFATHNAHTMAAVLDLAQSGQAFEFQRLHGMGAQLHNLVRAAHGTQHRIYAPVGAHRDLLAYLVRRLLENGANSSFVNQLTQRDIAADTIAADPFAALNAPATLPKPRSLFAPARVNSTGWDTQSCADLAAIENARAPFARTVWAAAPLLASAAAPLPPQPLVNPARVNEQIGTLQDASDGDIQAALLQARPWQVSAKTRAETLNRAADLYEENHGEILAILAREAGKTIPDAVAELREAVDFLRYYASQVPHLEQNARGIFTCISPWNFPLAIFTGQIAAALAAGNGVLAKPAETTPVMAHFATALLHRAGVARSALQLVLGDGPRVGAQLVSDARVAGVCFTGSSATAQKIARAMAAHLAPDAPLIAETGGLNAMVVDATALPEQAVRDIIASAFRSAGQRCSALRMLYVQADIAPALIAMLQGAMAELRLGDPWHAACDIGPLITGGAAADVGDYVAQAAREGRLLAQLPAPEGGHFIGPAMLRVGGIADVPREVFGPVLHIATYQAGELDSVLRAINARGYGLTFGLHTRITARASHVSAAVNMGNIYINRNQIGAVVGSQPFGGEGLSGTGPKAGGPMYLPRFTCGAPTVGANYPIGPYVPAHAVQSQLCALPAPARAPLHCAQMPGPTGEDNRLAAHPRGAVLCLGPTHAQAAEQARIARTQGCPALVVCDGENGPLNLADLRHLQGFSAVALWADPAALRAARLALSARDGALIPLITAPDSMAAACVIERHICTDTTAAGGNAALLSGQS